MIKRLVKNLIGGTLNNYFINKAKKSLAALPEGSAVFFFDIDNTIADTRGRRHLTGVNDFPGMIDLVKKSSDQGKVFFLSARNFITYASTSKWLKERGFPGKQYGLILLTEPNNKIEVLRIALNNKLKVILYDDLCYNHENGEIKKYDAVISEIKKLAITYKGIEDFKHLQ